MVMNGRIPTKSTDCVACHRHAAATGYAYPGMFCDAHPGGEDYVGAERYEPSDWVKQVVGKTYQGPFADGEFLCTGYDIRAGFWMQDIATGARRNVSERAIDRTFHRIR